MEDKGKYFGVIPENFQKIIEGTTARAKEQYALTDTQMTLFYTTITANNAKTR